MEFQPINQLKEEKMRMKQINRITVLVFVLLFSISSLAYAAPLQKSQLLDVLPGEPGAELTRAEFGAMLVKAADLQHGNSVEKLPADVNADAWYADSIKTLLSADIIRGFADGTVKPDKAISQTEAVVMVARALGLPRVEPARAVGDKISLADSHWAHDTYSWMVSEGLVTGVNAKQTMTPDAGAALLVNVFGTADECAEINAKIETANKDIKSLRMAGDMQMQMDMGQAPDVQTKASMQSELVLDKGMHMVMETAVPVKGEEKSFTVEQYMTNEGIFMNMPDPATNKASWKRIPKDMLPNMMDLLKQQSNPLSEEMKKMFHFRYLGEENLGDREVIKMAFYGEIKDFSQMLAALGQFNSQLQQTVSQAGGLLKSVSYLGKMYVDKETYLPVQVKNFSVVTYADKFQGQPFPIKSIRVEYDFKYSDYNQEINITLPEEALQAEELDLTPPADVNGGQSQEGNK
ncbi:S-layer homology domain-containing protein [Desulfoscipio geothermicus]|uniref:S-layer homology domain-containing protein n=1 Tax=Desulfoscipio geothermicus DSM 3669 TaxID=1121426 RepID=A0A1I6DK85_9FIRM|nr:S-layer homology domain-containing protein [Desulfoscipio geothermicus]SFR05752.1 S-layer homology domain-containing protein [Desulfoscipio geothermicus DSM 3669]